MSLKGHIALITGAAGGIGKEICKLFAEEGAVIVAADLSDATAVIESMPGGKESHMAAKVDVSQKPSVEDLAQSILARFGKAPTIVVCGAGVIGEPENFLECTEDQFDRLLGINWKGTFLINQKFMELMKNAETGGRIVNISSVNSGGDAHVPVYSASKAAIDVFTKAVSAQVAKYGIRVNAVRPGATDTIMVRGRPKEIQEELVEQTPMHRIGEPREIAELCLFLASDKASFITGSIILISGGFQR